MARFYMLGAYAGLTLIALTGNFWLALLRAPVLVGVVGVRQSSEPACGRSIAAARSTRCC